MDKRNHSPQSKEAVQSWSKRNIRLATAGIILAGVLFVATLLLLFAGGHPTTHLTATCLTSGIEIDLPFFYLRGKIYIPDHRSNFRSFESPEELAERINSLPQEDEAGRSYHAQVMSDRYLLIEATQNDLTALFYIYSEVPASAGEKNSYWLVPCQGSLSGEVCSYSCTADFYFPFYLLAEVPQAPYHETLLFAANGHYEVTGEKEDFLDFYRRTNLYTIEETTDGFLLRGGERRIPYFSSEFPRWVEEVPIHFSFSSKGDKRVLTMELYGEELCSKFASDERM